MNRPFTILASLAAGAGLLAAPLLAEVTKAAPQEDLAQKLEKHQVGSGKLANEQDELSADVQELIDEQTSPEVIALLEEVETVMSEVIDNLDARDTGGPTIAAETEIIEKIFEAAKKKAQQQQQPQQGEPKEGEEGEEGQEPGQQPGQQPGQGSSDAMLDMMRRMMGEEPGAEPQEGKGSPGSDGGNGESQTGESDTPNHTIDGSAEGTSAKRTVPKKSGTTGTDLPSEFGKALDAYNRPKPKPNQP